MNNKKFYFFLTSALFLGSFIIYHKIFYSIFIYSDSVNFFSAKKNLILYTCEMGRYISGVLYELFYSPQSLNFLIVARIFSLCTWILSAVAIVWVYKKLTPSIDLTKTLFIILIAMITVFNISTNLYVSWVACCQVGLGFSMALFSGYIFILSESESQLNKRVKYVFYSIILLICSLSCYQTIATAFFIPLYFLYRRKKVTPTFFRSPIIFSVGLGVYFLMFKSIIKLLNIEAHGRTSFVENIFEKLVFFVTEPLMNSFKIVFFNNQTNWIVLIPIGIIVYTIILHPILKNVKKGHEIYSELFILVLFLLLSYFPQLIVKENWASYRTTSVLLIFVSIIFLDCLFIRLKYHIKIKIGLFIFLGLGIFVRSYINTNTYFIEPSVHEYATVTTAIKNAEITQNTKILIIKPNWTTFETKFGVTAKYDEFAMPSSFVSWVTVSYIKLVINENYPRNISESINYRVENYKYVPIEKDSTLLILDLDKIIR